MGCVRQQAVFGRTANMMTISPTAIVMAREERVVIARGYTEYLQTDEGRRQNEEM